MKISVGIEKLAFFVVLFFILNHIWSCLWVIVGDYEDDDNKKTWLNRLENKSTANIYLTSIYFMI